MTAQAFTTRCMGRTRKLRSGWSIGSGLTTAPQPAHEHPLAYNRHAPCPTQRTHAIGLWVARNTALSRKDSAKFGISERRGPAPHQRPLRPGAPDSSFGTKIRFVRLRCASAEQLSRTRRCRRAGEELVRRALCGGHGAREHRQGVPAPVVPRQLRPVQGRDAARCAPRPTSGALERSS